MQTTSRQCLVSWKPTSPRSIWQHASSQATNYSRRCSWISPTGCACPCARVAGTSNGSAKGSSKDTMEDTDEKKAVVKRGKEAEMGPRRGRPHQRPLMLSGGAMRYWQATMVRRHCNAEYCGPEVYEPVWPRSPCGPPVHGMGCAAKPTAVSIIHPNEGQGWTGIAGELKLTEPHTPQFRKCPTLPGTSPTPTVLDSRHFLMECMQVSICHGRPSAMGLAGTVCTAADGHLFSPKPQYPECPQHP